MTARLLIIDPQNDFCDIDDQCALAVPGANSDMHRMGYFMEAALDQLEDVVITLDSHPVYAIERPAFWETGEGEDVRPFTQITEADVRAGRYLPRDRSLLAAVLAYLQALESSGKYTLMVWTTHCVVGTWGHNIHEAVAEQTARWECRHLRPALKVMKGTNPMTEQYSAVRAEVPDPKDPSTQTNHALIERVRPPVGSFTFVGGEASSHCVPATVYHLFEAFTPEERSRVVALSDCMSPVSGFEAQAKTFFETVRAAGGRVMPYHDALSLLA